LVVTTSLRLYYRERGEGGGGEEEEGEEGGGARWFLMNLKAESNFMKNTLVLPPSSSQRATTGFHH